MYLKNLKLVNYCGYQEHTFDFMKPDGKPYKFICFYGPNGIGKSSVLSALSLLTTNQISRSQDGIKSSLRKCVFSPDYDPVYDRLKDFKVKDKFAEESDNNGNEMIVEGTFVMEGKEYVVSVTQDGFVRNDLAPIDDPASGPWGDDHLRFRQRITHTLTADNDLIRSKFQIHYDQVKKFIPLIEEVFRYKAECPSPKGLSSYDRAYCTDVIINKIKKNSQPKIHFKSMSDGEQKICKSFSQILNLMYDLENPMPGDEVMEGWPRLILIDNIEMHVYFDRHVTFVDCLKREFNEQQIFATSHSGILIPRAIRGENDKENELWIDLEPING